MTRTTQEIITEARATLDAALAADWPALAQSMTEIAKSWLLGQVWGESRCGSSPDWGTSNNWGAVTYHLNDGHFLQHADHDANGNAVIYRFQAYDTQLQAARDWLHVLLRGGVPAALANGQARDVAAAMYANRYFTGVAGSADARIDAYAALIVSGANFVAGLLVAQDLGVDLASITGLQLALARLGFDPGPVDGLNGPELRAAIVAFQRVRGLTADGIAGPRTKSAILAALEQAA